MQSTGRISRVQSVRVSHWIVAASLLTLAVTGVVILMAHPRLYWGEVRNDLTPALLELPISRNYKHGGWENRIQFFQRIVVKDEFDDGGERGNIQNGLTWYTGI